MTNQQIELTQRISFEIGARGEQYNPAVIVDTLSVLHQYYSIKDLALMLVDEHKELCGISEAIQGILSDTYTK